MPVQNLLSYKNSLISYIRFGTGPATFICFHGYGEDSSSFEFLDKHVGNQYTFYAIDLPFHGKTEWREGLNFTTNDLVEIVNNIHLKETSRLPTPNSRLSLLGFSMGGRVALSLYQCRPETIGKLVLLAPEGLKMNFWHWLATRTWVGNKFFAFTMKHPGWFFGFLKLLNKIGLVNASIFKFVNHYIGDNEVRNLLYKRWTSHRKLKPGIKKIKKAIREQHTAVRLLYGKHDRIIRYPVAERFRKGIEEQSILTVILSGHQVLDEKHVAEIIPVLLH